MRLALLLNVIDSRIGGVLIMGDRGTGKSVAVRRNLQELSTQQGAENGAGAGGRCAMAQHLAVFSHRSRVPERRCAGAYRSRRRHKRCCATCRFLSRVTIRRPAFDCVADPQVRAMVEMLPEIEVVEDDAFNSDPRDPKNMGPDALQRLKAGEELPVAHVPTPLVRNAGRTVCCPHAGCVAERR